MGKKPKGFKPKRKKKKIGRVSLSRERRPWKRRGVLPQNSDSQKELKKNLKIAPSPSHRI